MNDVEFVKEWYKRGHKETESVFRFVCYFIAFNYLYNGCPDQYEWQRVKRFAEEKIKEMYPHNEIFDLLSENSEFYSYPISDMRSNCDGDERMARERKASNRFTGVKSKKITSLFLSIYQVRCNLFHGSKTMGSDRDNKLVEDGANLLGNFLEKWIQKKGGGADA